MKCKDKHLRTERHAAAMAVMAVICALLWLPWKSCAEEIQEAVMMEVLETTDVLEAPDTGAKLLGQLEKGDRIFAVKLAEGDWYRVAYQGEAGYVRQDVLKIYGSDQGASEDLYSPDQSGASQDQQGSDQGNGSGNPEAAGPSGEIIYPEEEFKKISAEAEKGKNRSVKITAGIFGAVILLIAADAAYTLVRAKKKAKAAGDGDIPEDIPDGMQDDIQDDMPDGIQDDISEDMLDGMQDDMSDDVQDGISDDMLDGIQDGFEDGQEQADDGMEFLDLQ